MYGIDQNDINNSNSMYVDNYRTHKETILLSRSFSFHSAISKTHLKHKQFMYKLHETGLWNLTINKQQKLLALNCKLVINF